MTTAPHDRPIGPRVPSRRELVLAVALIAASATAVAVVVIDAVR